MSYARQSIADFAAAVAERTPAPASGSAVAVAAALGAALAELTARFSDDAAAAADAERLRVRLLELADDDAEAYAEFMRTKSDPARRRIIEVPLELARTAAEVARIADRLEREGNPRLAGDAASASALAHSAVRAAARLAQINLDERARLLVA
jgi:methenyltetrahydrofolate cyclohydrolase